MKAVSGRRKFGLLPFCLILLSFWGLAALAVLLVRHSELYAWTFASKMSAPFALALAFHLRAAWALDKSYTVLRRLAVHIPYLAVLCFTAWLSGIALQSHPGMDETSRGILLDMFLLISLVGGQALFWPLRIGLSMPFIAVKYAEGKRRERELAEFFHVFHRELIDKVKARRRLRRKSGMGDMPSA